ENRRIRAGARGENGFLPESPERKGTRPGRRPVHRYHPLRGERRCGGGVRAEEQSQSHRCRRIPVAGKAAHRVPWKNPHRETARRCGEGRPTRTFSDVAEEEALMSETLSFPAKY